MIYTATIVQGDTENKFHLYVNGKQSFFDGSLREVLTKIAQEFGQTDIIRPIIDGEPMEDWRAYEATEKSYWGDVYQLKRKVKDLEQSIARVYAAIALIAITASVFIWVWN